MINTSKKLMKRQLRFWSMPLVALAMLTAVTVCAGVSVGPASAATKWTGNKSVVAITAMPGGGFILSLDSDFNSACTQVGAHALHIYPGEFWNVTTEAVQEMLALAINAFNTGDLVSVRYDDGTGYCWGERFVLMK